ncbi:hypothetical protein FRC19_003338 [Serendipita sp. 401]|nr:hypothetical protein FRC19_003338 [Serendipita sp. 401]
MTSILQEPPSRSPSVSLNLFQPGSLTPRQLTLLQELNYPPDLRPGQPFPLEFEAILRECWWGITPSQWEAIVVQAKEEARRRAGGATKQDLEKIHLEIECSVLENGLGDQLDRIERESGVHLPDNLKYLYASPGKLGSYFEEEYVPTDQDILRCRGRTTGIQETVFTLGKKGLGGTLNGSEPPSTTYPPGSGGGGPSVAETLNMAMAVDVGAGAGLASTSTPQTQTQQTSQSQSQTQTAQAHVPSTLKLSIGRTRLHFVDVGGQRSERRKWIHCFQDVTGVLFLVGLSGYNQGMIEDSTANQMQDAMSLWDGVCSSQWFKNTALILFLNKTDLFEAKVAKFPINTYFPDYDGDKEDIRAGLEYFRKRFLRIAVKSTRNLRNSDKKSKTGGTRPKAAPSSSSRSKVSAGGGSRKGKGRDREDDDEERPSSTAAAAAAGRKKSRDRLVEESTAGSRKGKGKERERVESNNDQAGQNPQQWSETVTSGTTTNNSYGQTTAVSVSSTSRKGKEREEGERAGVGEMGRIVSGSRSGGGSASTSTRAGGGVAGKSKAKAMESEEERRKRKDSAAAASASAAGGGAGANGGGGSKWRLGAKGGGVDGATKRGRMVYTHFTNATDTLQLRVVILAVCDIILRDNFMNANLI